MCKEHCKSGPQDFEQETMRMDEMVEEEEIQFCGVCTSVDRQWWLARQIQKTGMTENWPCREEKVKVGLLSLLTSTELPLKGYMPSTKTHPLPWHKKIHIQQCWKLQVFCGTLFVDQCLYKKINVVHLLMVKIVWSEEQTCCMNLLHNIKFL